MLERIFCRDDEKWGGEYESLISDRDLTLFHGFKESRLDFRRSTIDLISKEDIREYRSFAYLEFPCLRSVDLYSSQISR